MFLMFWLVTSKNGGDEKGDWSNHGVGGKQWTKNPEHRRLTGQNPSEEVLNCNLLLLTRGEGLHKRRSKISDGSSANAFMFGIKGCEKE